MSIISVTGIALVATIFSITLKKHTPEFSIIISIIAGIILLSFIVKEIPVLIEKIKNLISASGISSEYILILLKILGVSFLVQFTSDSCYDAGEKALASKVEFIGKIIIVGISLPLFEEIIKTVTKLLGG